MKLKLKNNIGSEYKHDDYNKTLISLRGQWVEVDTRYLFNDQYNLLDYDIRVFDSMIDAVQDDARKNACKCGYCGKVFFSIDDLNAHYLEVEEKAHNCEGCFFYRSHIVDRKHENEKTTDENGRVIEKRITTYVWEKQCSYDGDCDKFEHRKHNPNYFTQENTYFLRYPNGYEYYFNNLNLIDQWKELGYIYDENAKTATRKNVSGTYDAILYFTDNNIEKLEFKCTRKTFELSQHELFSLVKEKGSIFYLLKYENSKKREKELLCDIPKTRKKEIEIYLDSLQHLYFYGSDYKKRLFFGGVENDFI